MLLLVAESDGAADQLMHAADQAHIETVIG
jgi:hypothetical protein